MAQESSLGVLVFPWLPLKRKAVVGDICFAPITVGPSSQDVPSDIGSRLRIFRRFHKEPAEEPPTRELEPVAECAILAQADGIPIREFRRDQWLPVFGAIEAFCFAALAENEFWATSSFSAPYVNSSCFQSYFLGDDILVFPLRKRGPGEMQSWEYEDVVLTMPLQCSLAREVNWNDDFLSALWTVLDAKQLDPTLEQLRQAIWLFNRANTDDYQGLSVQQLQQEVVMIVEALEYLFGERKAEKLAPKVVSAIAATGEEITCAPPRIADCWVSKIKVPNNSRCLYYWLRELIQVRHHTVHGFAWGSNKWAWHVDEHLLMAAFVFPLIIKSILAADDLYELTEGDTVRLGVIDKLLYMDNWGREEEHGESNWSKAFRDHKDKQALDKMAAHLREIEAEGNPISPDRGTT